jgi:hypothetical protein
VLYELATGQHPTRVSSGASIVRPSELAPGINPELEDAIPAVAVAVTAGAAAVGRRVRVDAAGRRTGGARPLRPCGLGRRPDVLDACVVGRIAGVIVFLVAIGALLRPLAPRTAPPLTDLDTIVLADFTNTTDEPLFDGALRSRSPSHSSSRRSSGVSRQSRAGDAAVDGATATSASPARWRSRWPCASS